MTQYIYWPSLVMMSKRSWVIFDKSDRFTDRQPNKHACQNWTFWQVTRYKHRRSAFKSINQLKFDVHAIVKLYYCIGKGPRGDVLNWYREINGVLWNHECGLPISCHFAHMPVIRSISFISRAITVSWLRSLSHLDHQCHMNSGLWNTF